MQVLTHQDIPPEADPTGEVLLDRSIAPFRFWVPVSKALVLGHSQDPARELRLEAARRDGIPIHRRMGGGGAVLLSPACVCVGLRFAKAKGLTLHDFFEAGSDLIRRAVQSAIGLSLESRGISDLACPTPDGVRKVVGCSLYMPRDFALYLGSILVHPGPGDLADLDTYLAHPSREPDYRAGRPHADFVAGLSALSPTPITPHALLSALEAAQATGLKASLDWPAGQG